MPSELLQEWVKLVQPFKSACIIFGRPYCFWSPDNPIVDTQLHGFSDASKKAYGACVYIRYEKMNGETKCELVTSKFSIAPIKERTIPRLELMACLTLVNLVNVVMAELACYSLSCVRTWTDSMVAYFWILNNKSDIIFVRNRVRDILNIFPDTSLWSYVRSKDNPADLGSRGLTPKALTESNVWSNGPNFLYLSKDHWPNILPDKSEFMKCINDYEYADITSLLITVNCLSLSELLDVSKFSSLLKLLRVTSYVLRFVRNLKSCFRKEDRASVADSNVRRHDNAELDSVTAEFTVRRSEPSDTCLVNNIAPRKQYSLRSRVPVNQQLPVGASQASAHELELSNQETQSSSDSGASEPLSQKTQSSSHSETSEPLSQETQSSSDSKAAEPTNQKLLVDQSGKVPVAQQATIGRNDPPPPDAGKLIQDTDHNMVDVSTLNASLIEWLKVLQSCIPNKRFASLVKQFNCFFDEHGLARCKGRLEHSSLSYNQKFPILIDGNHVLVKLLILHSHLEVKHEGVKSTLAHLRNKVLASSRSQ